MSLDVFQRAMDVMLPNEIGYSNNPKDPGKATLDGVTQRTYDAWREHEDLPKRPVRLMTPEERGRIYFTRYWIGEGSPSVLANAGMPLSAIGQFDWAVNAGPQRGTWYVQAAVGARPDGIWGPYTLGRIDRAKDAVVAAQLLVLRSYHYRARCGDLQALQRLTEAGLGKIAPKPRADQDVFLNGWLARLRHVARACGLAIDPAYAKTSVPTSTSTPKAA